MNGWHNDFCFTEIVSFDDQFSANCCFLSEAVNRKIESASFFFIIAFVSVGPSLNQPSI